MKPYRSLHAVKLTIEEILRTHPGDRGQHSHMPTGELRDLDGTVVSQIKSSRPPPKPPKPIRQAMCKTTAASRAFIRNQTQLYDYESHLLEWLQVYHKI
jgi:hypothetical protein